MTERSRASTGDSTLDAMLDGGLPRNRSTLVTGGPGTGKSTLGMQFLQAGLDAGESCLFVSTEQTVDELRDSFADFAFDLDDDRLGFLTVHATPGRTIGSDEPELTIQSLGRAGVAPDPDVPPGADDPDRPVDPDAVTDENRTESPADAPAPFEATFARPFSRQHLLEYLRPHGPCDRVVFDSVSGLRVVAEDDERYRRSVLDLIRFFSDEFGATSLFTAEAVGDDGADPLQYTTHGVVELRREPIDDDPHRFLTVRKLRGVDHDRRTVEVEFVPGGLRAAPSRRSQPPALKDHAHRSVGIDGLDRLCGGGLLRGAGVLLEHDGRANLSALFGTILAGALESDHDVTLVPTIGLRESRVRVLLDGHDLAMETLLEDGRLRVVDVIGAWDGTLPGVRRPAEPGTELRDQFAELVERSDRTNFALVNADAVVHALGVDEARSLGYFAQAQLLGSDDALVYVSNPETIPEMAAAFHRDAAEQVLETWIADDGLQYVSLRKSPCGFVGSTALVEYVDDPPYLRVQDPPQSRENPYAEE